MMSEDQHSTAADEARAQNGAILNGYWQRAVEHLVGQGVPWAEASVSMLSIASLNVETCMGLDFAERSLIAAAGYLRTKREASEALDKITSSKRRH